MEPSLIFCQGFYYFLYIAFFILVQFFDIPELSYSFGNIFFCVFCLKAPSLLTFRQCYGHYFYVRYFFSLSNWFLIFFLCDCLFAYNFLVYANVWSLLEINLLGTTISFILCFSIGLFRCICLKFFWSISISICIPESTFNFF